MGKGDKKHSTDRRSKSHSRRRRRRKKRRRKKKKGSRDGSKGSRGSEDKESKFSFEDDEDADVESSSSESNDSKSSKREEYDEDASTRFFGMYRLYKGFHSSGYYYDLDNGDPENELKIEHMPPGVKGRDLLNEFPHATKIHEYPDGTAWVMFDTTANAISTYNNCGLIKLGFPHLSWADHHSHNTQSNTHLQDKDKDRADKDREKHEAEPLLKKEVNPEESDEELLKSWKLAAHSTSHHHPKLFTGVLQLSHLPKTVKSSEIAAQLPDAHHVEMKEKDGKKKAYVYFDDPSKAVHAFGAAKKLVIDGTHVVAHIHKGPDESGKTSKAGSKTGISRISRKSGKSTKSSKK